MPKQPTNTEPAPITRDELGEFLLWFFTETGHAAHVETWRRSKAPAPKPEDAAG